MVAGRAQAEENLCAAWATNNTSSRRRQCLLQGTDSFASKGGRRVGEGGRETNAACICESN